MTCRNPGAALSAAFVLIVAIGCTGRKPTACDVLSADDIGKVVRATTVKTAEGSGFNQATGIDTCRWTADAEKIELRVYHADSSAEDAWKMVFESARAHATTPAASGRIRARSLTGVGDEAMLLFDSGSGASVAFRAGRTGGTIGGIRSEELLIELAKRAASRLR
jgi:hypothetical protein